jgi:hypothetical protein
LKSGSGTTEGTFAGTLEAESYVALYADDYTYPINGNPAIILPSTQQSYFRDEENNIAPYVWPMIAISDSKEFQFQNLCSILKVSLTGSGETLTQINVESKSGNEYLAGYFYVKSLDDTNMLEPYYSASTVINYRCNLTLSSDPVDCYIVVPAQYYSEGLSFTICTDRGNMEVSSGKLTTYRSRFYDIPVDVEPVPMPDGVYLEPRYFPIIFAFDGDSTIRSVLPVFEVFFVVLAVPAIDRYSPLMCCNYMRIYIVDILQFETLAQQHIIIQVFLL